MIDDHREREMGLIGLLPAIYQDPGSEERPNYLPRFLSAFEKILFSPPESSSAAADSKSVADMDAVQGLREKIVQMAKLVNPWLAQDRFLPWLAAWMAFSLRSNLQLERKRELIANMIPLYRIRGTRKYLEELLRLCVDASTAIEEEDVPALQIGKHSTLGKDMYIGGGAPHFFRVRIVASHLNVPALEEQRRLAYEVVELAKPAHTTYELWMDSPQMQIGVHSKVGIDTVLGSAHAV
jgi:phage tail-like protein